MEIQFNDGGPATIMTAEELQKHISEAEGRLEQLRGYL